MILGERAAVIQEYEQGRSVPGRQVSINTMQIGFAGTHSMHIISCTRT